MPQPPGLLDTDCLLFALQLRSMFHPASEDCCWQREFGFGGKETNSLGSREPAFAGTGRSTLPQ
jgi:hypothetical protein